MKVNDCLDLTYPLQIELLALRHVRQQPARRMKSHYFEVAMAHNHEKRQPPFC
jgi:hypothetical protein